MIVCVLDMGFHLTNQNAIDMAKKVDPAGRRTLGVVTKPDGADSPEALDQLRDGDFKMGLGFVVVSFKYPLQRICLRRRVQECHVDCLVCCCASAPCLSCDNLARRQLTSKCCCEERQAQCAVRL